MNTCSNHPWRVRTIVVLLLIISACVRIQAQQGGEPLDDVITQIGAYIGYNHALYSADFQELPGVPCCSPGFTSGSGPGLFLGLNSILPVTGRLRIDFRSDLAIFGGALSTTEVIGNAPQGSELVDATVEHRIEPALLITSAGIGASYYPLSMPLVLSAGVNVGRISSAEFSQNEVLVSPSTVRFSNGARERNTVSGVLEGADGLQLGAYVGVGYDIGLSRDWILTPQAEFDMAFTDLLDDRTWKANALRVGVGLSWRLHSSEPAMEGPTPGVALAVVANGLRGDGTETPAAEMTVEEFLDTRTVPVLPYVFFEHNSARIPARYVVLPAGRTSEFSEESLYGSDAVSAHHSLLNVIGRRLREHPSQRVTLVGCNSGVRQEQGNRELSEQRAEAVRDYLRDVWGIDQSRLRVEVRDLPAKPSNPEDPDGIEENRRVEIIADHATILPPIVMHDTLRQSDPPVIRFRPSISSEVGIDGWELALSQGGRALHTFSGTGLPPAKIDWDISQNRASAPRTDSPLDYTLTMRDPRGRRYSSTTGQLDVEQLTIRRKRIEQIADRQYHRFSLMLFDFGSADLGPSNLAMVNLMKPYVERGSSVEITGYTDRMGDDAFNQSLSERRAKALSNALRSPGASVRGLGESQLLHDNDLPEGRFFCRTVNVVIQTPVGR